MLNVFHLLTKYSKRYEKHISYEDLKTTTPMEFISKKFVFAFVAVILYLLTKMFQYKSVGIFGIIFSFLIGFFEVHREI